MEKKNDRNKNTSQNKLYSDEIKEMERLSEEQEKALRERRQARKHRIKKQERRKKLIVLGSMAVVTVVVAVSAVTGIVSFVTRERISRKGLIGADFDRYGETESFRSGSG